MPEMISGDIPEDVLCEVCGFCGIALYNHEISGEILNGIFIDYEKREAGPASFVLCPKCKQFVVYALTLIANRDIEPAVDRRTQLIGDEGT